MGGVKLKIHPLFFLFGLYYAFTGKIFLFATITLCAVIHELGHSFVAQSLGYKLNKITLMPFGAVATGEIEGLKAVDQIKIALAGPFVNLATGVFFLASWWLFPKTYAYTDIAAQTCFSLAFVNLIPAFPLDGGRVLHSVISMKKGNDVAFKICRLLGVCSGTILLALFVLSCFYRINLSLLFFGLFVFFGALENTKENRYVKIYSSFNENRLKRGVKIKIQAVSAETSVKTVFSLLDETALNEIRVYNGEKLQAVLTQKHLSELLLRADRYSPIKKYL